MNIEDLTVFSPCEAKEKVHVYGRTSVYNNSLVLFWTASGFALETVAPEVWAELEGNFSVYEPWVSVWVDGVQVSRFMLQKGKAWYCLFRGFSGKDVHRIALLKETQAMSGDNLHKCIVHNIALPKPCTIATSLFVPKAKSLKLEFVGDSITTGEGLSGAEQEMDWIPAWMALQDNYALSVSRALDADFHILSQSGWGIATSWDNDPTCALPQYYTKTCGLAFGEENEKLGAHAEHSFDWQPDVVIVNLGTNDWGAFSSPSKTLSDGTSFKLHLQDGKPVKEDVLFVQEKITQFLTLLHQKNPQAHLLWVYGMVSLDFAEEIKEAVLAFSNVWKKTYFLPLVPMSQETKEEKGSRAHPGRGTHKRAANIVIEKIREIL